MKLLRFTSIAILVLVAGIATSAQSQMAATTFQVAIGKDASNPPNCTQTVNGNSNFYAPIDETSGDNIVFSAVAPLTSVTVNFPVGTAAFPGTPFWDANAGQWVRVYGPSTTTTTLSATLPAQAGKVFRYPYALVTFNDGSHCNFPIGGMGVQVTK